VARVWLNRPWKKNCVTVPILERLDEIITEVDKDPDLRVLVLRGRGGTFCSGFDLDELQSNYIGSSTAMDVAVVSAPRTPALPRHVTPNRS
jgi:enoyl-CoA hydratase/carnithine racemase